MLALVLAILLCFNSAYADTLSASARSRLRFRLENLSNDIELTLRNHRSDELDFRSQGRMEEVFKIRERIPFEARPGEIREQLSRSARKNQIGFSGFKLTARDLDPEPVPRAITLGERTFRLRPGQVAESIGFRFVAKADRARLLKWLRGWHDSMRRLMNPETSSAGPIRWLGDGRWEVRGRAFRFRNLRFPKLRFADPRSLLPAWAQNDPKLFARQEPALWSIVEKAEKTAPQAAPLLGLKERFMLRDARIGFFLLKAGAPPDARIN